MATTETDMGKKMRLLDMNQKAYTDDTNAQLRRQNDLLQTLMKENETLKQELMNSTKHRPTNISHANEVGSRTDKCDLLEHKLATSNAEKASLEEQMRDTKKQIHESRKSLGGVNISKEHQFMVDRQVAVLENRLDQALVKFNEALSGNKELREQIDNLRRERVVFDGIYKKLERELHEKKKQMADIIEQSNLFYEERDMATHELSALKLAAEKDMMQYEEHFRELDIMIEADKNLKETLKQSQRMKPGLTKKPLSAEEKEQQQEEKEKMKRSIKSASAKEVFQDEAASSKTSAEEAIRLLEEGTGIHDVKVLLEKFINAEEQNFSMYNFVNDLNKEVEVLTDRITALRVEHDKYKGSGLDGARAKALHDLEDKLAVTERMSEEYDEKSTKAEESISEVRAAIESLFNKLGCQLDEMSDMLGTTQCTENTMLTFLGIIEQRTTELLSMYNVAMSRKKKKAGEEDDDDHEEMKVGFIGSGPAIPFGSANVHVGTLPTTGETFSNEGVDDAEDDRVLTQEELRAQTEARLAAKEEQHAKGREARKAKPKKKKQFE